VRLDVGGACNETVRLMDRTSTDAHLFKRTAAVMLVPEIL